MHDAEQLLGSNRALVERFTNAIWNERKFDDLDNFVAPNYQQHNANLADGIEALRQFLEGFYSQNLAQGRFEIQRMVAEGDLVVAHSLFRAQPEDTGTVVVDIYRIENGLLAEHWDIREPVPVKTASGRPTY